MKILLLVIFYVAFVNALAATDKKVSATKSTNSSNDTTKETRGKRNLNFFGNFVSNRRQDSYNYQPSGYNYDANNYIGSGSSPDHHNYHRNHHHHYPEPPEPIIEIIIQDNNETLPEPQPIVSSNGKKKKEQVQVFYVKYHKDEKKGLVIHEPVAALSPAGHEQHEEEEDHHEHIQIVTPVPNVPRQTTTLRTIIRPDSEQYESNSGVHVTFNKPHNHHSKSDNHIHDEEKVESAIQPVIQLPQSRVGPLPVLPIKEKRQQPPFTQGRIVNAPSQVHNGNFHNVQSVPHQRPHVDFNPQNNFIAHPHQTFLSSQLTLPSQEPSKPFHPNVPPFNPQLHRPQQPLSIPINHHQNQHGALGHQQQINQRLPPLQAPVNSQQAPLLKPPQRLPAPQVSFNQNQRPFNYHAHAQQSQQVPQNVQRPQQISPPRQGPPPQNFHNFNQQLPPLNRPPVQFNPQFAHQQHPEHQIHSQGPPINFKPEQKIPPIPQKHVQNQFVQQPPVHHNPNVFQGGLTEQAAPNLARPAHYQQLPQQNPPPPFQNQAFNPPQHDVHFNQQKFIQNTFGTDVQVSSSVPKFEHHITEMVNPPNFFQPQVLDMDKLRHQDNGKNIGPLIGQIGNLMVTQKPLVLNNQQQHRFAPPPTPVQQQSNQFVFPTQQSNFQQPPQNSFEVSGRNNFAPSTSAPINRPTATTTIKQQPTTTVKPQVSSSTTAKPKAYFELPDEVPDDLRKQLEESGVLENAQISILDYDKIGDTSLQDLPPEHLANFFSAGGGAQIGASNKIISVLKPNGESVGDKLQSNKDFTKLIGSQKVSSKKEDLNLRVVKFDMQSHQPQIQHASQNYSRYLPIKINGAHFPVSDISELRGKRILSVVVLAPVAQEEDSQEFDKDVFEAKQIKFLSGETIKNLIKKPSTDNFKKWLELEQKTISELQSVVLLVTKDSITNEQQIFMYDISSKTVSHLSGELSSKFVNIAEENESAQDENGKITEQIDRIDTDIEPDVDSSDIVEQVVDLDGKPLSEEKNEGVLINSGYSVIKND